MSDLAEHDPELAQAARAAARSRRADKRTKLVLAALSLLLAATLAAVWWLAASNAQLAEENASFGAQQQGEKKEIAKEASRALCGQGDREIYDRDLCAKWAEAAQEPTVTPEAKPLDTGPSQADLVNAFRAYCAEGNCRGADGQPPTADDIAAAFVRFCADGRCTGPAGQDGKPGERGIDATPLAPQYEMVLAAVTEVCGTGVCTGPTGQPGPGPTQEVVIAAVQTVCANDACRGPAGPPGADSIVPGPQGVPGTPGEPGRGVADTYCQDNGIWQITYTDGTVDTDAGRCRADVLPPIGGTP
jgi:hypothetical protein